MVNNKDNNFETDLIQARTWYDEIQKTTVLFTFGGQNHTMLPINLSDEELVKLWRKKNRPKLRVIKPD